MLSNTITAKDAQCTEAAAQPESSSVSPEEKSKGTTRTNRREKREVF